MFLASFATDKKGYLSRTAPLVPVNLPCASTTTTCISSFSPFLFVMNVDVSGFASNSFAYIQLLNAAESPATHLSMVNPLAKSPGYLPKKVFCSDIKKLSLVVNSSSFLIVCAVFAESDEYAAVPEFPLGSGALLIASVSSYIILSRNPEKVINTISKISHFKR